MNPCIECGTNCCLAQMEGKECKAMNYEARPHGEWIYNQYCGNPNVGNWHCSECRHIVYVGYGQKPDYNFCPNCGADMRVKDELNQVSKELNSEIEKSKSKICPCIDCCKLDNSESCRKGCLDYQKWKEGR